MKILHCSDIHLGKTLDSHRKRYEDYFTAFRRIAEMAIENRVRCLVIAGDLFHRGNVDPSALADTAEILDRLRRESTEVVAIEGNHDYLDRERNESWLLYLSRRGYLTLLKPSEDPERGVITFEPFQREKGWGGFTDIDGIRFYGLGYWSTSVAEQLSRASESLPSDKRHVALLHAGVWDRGLMDLGRVTTAELRPLSRYFRYVALGHGHRPYEVTDEEGFVFAYNPGAPEIVNREEAKGPQSARGRVCLVDLSEERPGVEYLFVERRPYHQINIDIDGAGSPEEALKTAEEKIRALGYDENPPVEPVVILTLTGRTAFNPSAVDQDRIKEMLARLLNPLLVQIYNGASMIRRTGAPLGKPGDLDRIYRDALTTLVSENLTDRDPAPVVDLIYGMLEESRDPNTGSREMMEIIHKARMAMEGGSADER